MILYLFRCLVAITATFVCLAAYALEPAIIYGVNRVNLNQLPVPRRGHIIRHMVDHGVQVARINIVQPAKNGLETVKIARANNLSLVINFGILTHDYLRKGTVPRPAIRKFTARPRLSDLDIDRFFERFEWLWRRIEEINPQIVAVEMSNELNWADFNGDLNVSSNGTRYDKSNYLGMPSRKLYEQGLTNYISVLRFVKKLRDSSTVFGKVPIISAGTADISTAWANQSGGDVVDSELFVSLLKDRGLMEIIDGVGLHVYPNGPDWKSHIGRSMQVCGQGGSIKPCWITEWGVPNNGATCPLDDNLRASKVRETRQEFLKIALTGALKGVFYYDWDADRSFSIWRCGSLTISGRIILEH